MNDSRECKKAERPRLRAERSERRERRRMTRRCFWTWPWGHVYIQGVSVVGYGYHTCGCCGRLVWTD